MRTEIKSGRRLKECSAPFPKEVNILDFKLVDVMQIAQSYFEGNGVLIAIVHREIENDENPNAPTVVHDERLLPIQSLQQLKDVKSEIGAREKVEIAIINTCEYTVRGIKPPRKKRNSAKHHEEI